MFVKRDPDSLCPAPHVPDWSASVRRHKRRTWPVSGQPSCGQWHGHSLQSRVGCHAHQLPAGAVLQPTGSNYFKDKSLEILVRHWLNSGYMRKTFPCFSKVLSWWITAHYKVMWTYVVIYRTIATGLEFVIQPGVTWRLTWWFLRFIETSVFITVTMMLTHHCTCGTRTSGGDTDTKGHQNPSIEEFCRLHEDTPRGLSCCTSVHHVHRIQADPRVSGRTFLHYLTGLLALLLLVPSVRTSPIDGVRLEDHLVHTQVKPGKLATRVRPNPSDDLPVSPPLYPADKQLLPSGSELDPERLQSLLGTELDPAFMSTSRPLEAVLRPNGTYVYDLNARQMARAMPQDLQDLRLPHLPERRARRLRPRGRRSRRALSRYLAAYTFCPVRYQWRDLGDRFWPRWLREGSCTTERSCSVPEGMSCKAQDSETKTVLWWHCRGRKKCSWIRIGYPIITKCSCSC